MEKANSSPACSYTGKRPWPHALQLAPLAGFGSESASGHLDKAVCVQAEQQPQLEKALPDQLIHTGEWDQGHAPGGGGASRGTVAPNQWEHRTPLEPGQGKRAPLAWRRQLHQPRGEPAPLTAPGPASPATSGGRDTVSPAAGGTDNAPPKAAILIPVHAPEQDGGEFGMGTDHVDKGKWRGGLKQKGSTVQQSGV